MPKKLPGIDLQFAISDDEGNVETGIIRCPPKVMAFKAMRAIQKAVERLGKDAEPEPKGPANG